MQFIDSIEGRHAEMVNNLAKSGGELLREATPEKMHMNHMIIGLAGEVGELADAIKRYTMYDKEMDMTNVLEELGDIEFYLAGLRDVLGVTREMALKANYNKLSVRYSKGTYSNEAAINREDKKGE